MNAQTRIAITTGGKKHLPYMSELYCEEVRHADAEAVFIGPDDNLIDAVKHYDGFIIPGGGDINPLLYNEKKVADMDFEEEKRVNFDFDLLRAALKQSKPVLGICYGMQLINIALGGTLYQDIGAQKGACLNHREGTHTIKVDDNPYIRAGRYEVNSSHHQGVKEIGTGLEAFAYAQDGVIEAFYYLKYRFLLGVQWHPERMRNWISGQVFTQFIEACRDCK